MRFVDLVQFFMDGGQWCGHGGWNRNPVPSVCLLWHFCGRWSSWESLAHSRKGYKICRAVWCTSSWVEQTGKNDCSRVWTRWERYSGNRGRRENSSSWLWPWLAPVLLLQFPIVIPLLHSMCPQPYPQVHFSGCGFGVANCILADELRSDGRHWKLLLWLGTRQMNFTEESTDEMPWCSRRWRIWWNVYGVMT